MTKNETAKTSKYVEPFFKQIMQMYKNFLHVIIQYYTSRTPVMVSDRTLHVHFSRKAFLIMASNFLTRSRDFRFENLTFLFHDRLACKTDSYAYKNCGIGIF